MDFERNRDEAIRALIECRDGIDALDREILDLLNRRTLVVERIGAIKRRWGMPIYEPKREDEVFRNVADHNHGPLPPEAARRVFERIIDEMRNVQRLRILEEEGK
jgi:chorismate mutase-like protein